MPLKATAQHEPARKCSVCPESLPSRVRDLHQKLRTSEQHAAVADGEVVEPGWELGEMVPAEIEFA